MIDEQCENLKTLAHYLKGQLREGVKFDMRLYYNPTDSGIYSTDCGSVGCAVGHGPYAGISKSPKESWTTYIDRAFGIETHTVPWAWLFAYFWAETPFNQAHHAADRILAYLAAGDIPYSDPSMKDMLHEFNLHRDECIR